ncbi:HIG1 domain-containing protein [Roseiterribacter gracilis]|uniref:HIG1 domain-containing protein n=1 Tax=Roseiterribacter gracilis TaxID=2812848 RepID=A0A8S8XAZ3_9PROT|nr:hypothetical protein TMPK1_10260 [Rhodospirillales bacterium TMPK1]
MRMILIVLLGLTLVGVVAVLLIGVVAMGRGGDFNRKYGNLLMRARVGLQALALLLLAALYFSPPS